MSEPDAKTAPGFWKRLEARGDAWAKKRLCAEEFAEAAALDIQLKQHWLKYLFWYFGCTVLLTLGLMLLKGRTDDWPKALLVANLLAMCALVFFASAWYGYRKWTGARARRNFAITFASMVAAWLGAIAFDMVVNHRVLFDMAPQKLSALAGTTLLMAFVAFALILSIANLRQRENEQRMALLRGEAEREKLARHGAQAELKLLQAQVEPHFLFNTLANVRYLVQTGSPDALAMLDHLTSYLRSSLPELRSESSTVAREAELARAYLEIMRLRMGGALGIEIEVPAELAHAPFPPMMVMTLVENAIKHGVAPKAGGNVAVRASAAGGKLRVAVEDDGHGLVGPIGRGVGLANVRERLAALFGEGARLKLETRGGGGTSAVIEVPER